MRNFYFIFISTSENETNNRKKWIWRVGGGWCWWVLVGVTHSEPAAMSRYEVSAVSTPTGMTMLMTFSADQFLSY